MYPDSVLHALTEARRHDLLSDAAHARAVRAARGRRAAHRAPGLLRRLTARGARGRLLPTPSRRPAEQAL